METVTLKNEHTLLLVDDENAITRALRRLFRKEGYRILTAQSGAEGLERLAQSKNPVSLIISDQRMPQMNGARFLEATKEIYPEAIRYLLTGYSEMDPLIQAVNKGEIDRYLTKPWNDEDLLLQVRQSLQHYELISENRRLSALTIQQNKELSEINHHLEKKVEQRTQQYLKIRSQAEIGKYASEIVHNLNNPLHALGISLSLLEKFIASQQNKDMDKINKTMALANKSAEDLQQIISGILLHARDERKFQNHTIDINTIIQQELRFFGLNPEFKHRIEKRICLKDNLNPIMGNASQIKQIVDNLIRNAIDAMENSATKVLTIKTASINEAIEIEIGDTGQGISKNNLPYIFSSDFSTKPIGKGTGLGLASVKTMVESYGGKIMVCSQEERGTTFTVQIPTQKRIDGL